MKRFLIFFFCFLSSQAYALTVTSLNIKWYGRGGRASGDATSEHRNQHIKDFIGSYIPKTDVLVFQEITDPEMLMGLFSELECFTYGVDSYSHQYIVMCAKKGSVKSFSANHEVRLGRRGLRAALVGEFEFEDKTKLKIVGLHLKAGWKESRVRLAQITKLKPSIEDESIPTLVIGDFNTYKSNRTGLEKDDATLIAEKLTGFDEFSNNTSTYIGFGGRVFDRAWSRGLTDLKAQVFGPCEKTNAEDMYKITNFYKYYVSDHCAFQVNFKVEK